MKPYPEGWTVVTVSLTLPSFVKVTACEFDVPTATLPNAIVGGETLTERVLAEAPGASGFEPVRPMQPADSSNAKRAAATARPRRDVVGRRRAELNHRSPRDVSRVRGSPIGGHCQLGQVCKTTGRRYMSRTGMGACPPGQVFPGPHVVAGLPRVLFDHFDANALSSFNASSLYPVASAGTSLRD